MHFMDPLVPAHVPPRATISPNVRYQPSIAILPIDIQRIILLQLKGDTPAVSLVCKAWKQIIEEDLLDIPVIQKVFVPSNLRQLPLPGFPPGVFTHSPMLLNTPTEVLAIETSTTLTVYSKKPVSHASKQTTLERKKRIDLGGNGWLLKYLVHSPEYLLFLAGENVQVVDRATYQITTLSPKIPHDLFRFENEDQKTVYLTYLQSHKPKEAHLTPSNQIVMISETGVVSLWDPKTLHCLKVILMFSCSNAIIDWISPKVLSTHLIGSMLIVNGYEGIPCDPKTFGARFRPYGCLYALDLNTFTPTRLIQGHAFVSISSDTHLIVKESQSHVIQSYVFQGYRLDRGHLTKVWTSEQKKFVGKLVGVNAYCLIYISYDNKNCHTQFTVVSADTGKKLAVLDFPNARNCRGFITKQLALFYFETNNEKFLDVYVTPLGKKVASYKLSELCIDFVKGKSCDIQSINYENNQLTIVYVTEFVAVNEVYALVISMPEEAILTFAP